MTIGKEDSAGGGAAGGSPAGRGGGPGRGGGAGPGSPIEFRLDGAFGVPVYLQLVQQVEHALRLGYLKPGDQLPKVRDVVGALAINPNTVLKAYRELETKGLAAGRPGQGTFIVAGLGQVALPELAGLRRSLLGWLAEAAAAGLDQDGVVALVTSALRDSGDRRGGPGGRAWRCGWRGGGGGVNVIEASGLGKRYGSTWAVRGLAVAIPAGRVAALVGPNGAGKTTLLNLVVGLAAPTAGVVTVLGGRPPGSRAALDGIAFVAQNTPLYKGLSAADMLHLTANLNRRFDQGYAQARLAELGIPLKQRADRLSGGQQAQLALTLALARRPQLLVLDEPMAMLDPLARHDFMATVMTAVADHGVSVVLSSHVLAELERVADYLIVMSAGQVQVAGEVDQLLASHHVLTGPAADAGQTAARLCVVHASHGQTQAHLLTRTTPTAGPPPPGWQTHPVSLEQLTLAYLRQPAAAALPGPASTRNTRPAEATR